MRTVPSSAAARATRPASPVPAAGSAPPRPSSSTETARIPRSVRAETAAIDAIGVLDHVRQRLGDQEVRRRFGARIRALSPCPRSIRTGTGIRPASSSSAAPRPWSTSTAGWIPRTVSRRDAEARSACDCTSASAVRAPRPGVRAECGELEPEHAQSGGEHDELLLHPVVQVALDPAPFLGVRGHDRGARPGQLFDPLFPLIAARREQPADRPDSGLRPRAGSDRRRGPPRRGVPR